MEDAMLSYESSSVPCCTGQDAGVRWQCMTPCMSCCAVLRGTRWGKTAAHATRMLLVFLRIWIIMFKLTLFEKLKLRLSIFRLWPWWWASCKSEFNIKAWIPQSACWGCHQAHCRYYTVCMDGRTRPFKYFFFVQFEQMLNLKYSNFIV